MSMIILPSQFEPDTMTATLFDRNDLETMGPELKQTALLAIIATRGVNMTDETFNALVLEAFMLNNYVVRAQILEHVADDLTHDKLTEKNVDKAIEYLVKKIDGAAAKLGRMVELVEECKTPGPRH